MAQDEGAKPTGGVACPFCEAQLTAGDLAEGWCDSCGKRIPLYVQKAAEAGPAPAKEPTPGAQKADRMVCRLMADLAARQSHVRWGAAVELGKLGSRARPAVDRLQQVSLSDRDSLVREAARKALAQVAPDQFPESGPDLEPAQTVGRPAPPEVSPSFEVGPGGPGPLPEHLAASPTEPTIPSVIRPVPIPAPPREGAVGRLFRRASGLALTVIGSLMGLAAASFFYRSFHGQVPDHPFWVSALFAFLGSTGVVLCSLGRRLRTPRAWESTAHDARPPVLLLRAFADDGKVYLEDGHYNHYLWTEAGTNGRQTFEEHIAAAFRSIGPVIAVGRPGELAAPLGAARFYVSNDDWHRHVTELLVGCQAVVMFLGRINGNDGLAWEVDQVFRTAAPEKLVLIVPPLREEELRARWDLYRQRTRGRLPAHQGGELLVRFGPSWEADVRRARLSWSGGGRERQAYAAALQDVIAAFEWRAVGINRQANTTVPPVPPAEYRRLIQQIEGPRPEARWEAAVKLGQMGPAARAAVPQLEALLGDPDELVRRAAARSLRAIQGAEAAEASPGANADVRPAPGSY